MRFAVYRNYVSLQVLFKSIRVKLILAIVIVSVLHTDGSSIGIVEIENKVVAPLLSHDKRAREVIDVSGAVDCLTGSDSFVVVFEGEDVSFFRLLLIVVVEI